MTTIELSALCHDCSVKLGWVPVGWPVGIWPGKCDYCGEEKNLCAPRDYRTKDGKWVNPEVEMP